ncbi:MAG: PAS domain-containing protein [Proteobacteria bacterium]|nr:PAS domain-containing protein [Pseudomonadota bacterium]
MSALISDLEAAFEEVLAALAENRNGVLEKYTDLSPPVVTWEPAPESIPIPVLADCLTRWHALRGARALPDWSDFRTEEFRSVVTRATIVDPVPGTTDMRYRLFGSRLTEIAGRDWEGSTLSDMAKARRSLGPLLIRAVYILARERQIPAYTWHARATRSQIEGWHRLVLPFSAPEPYGIRFVAAMEVDMTVAPAPGPVAEVFDMWQAASRGIRSRIDAIIHK